MAPCWTTGEVEAGEVLVGWEASSLHVAGNGPDLPLGDFGLQQLPVRIERHLMRLQQISPDQEGSAV